MGMEVERPTDGAVGLGRDVPGVTTTGSTDTTATAERGRSGGVARQRTDVGRQGAGAKAKRKAKRDKYAHFSRDT